MQVTDVDRAFSKVAHFMDTFNAMQTPDVALKLVVEESQEVLEAYAHLLKELSDLAYVQAGFVIASRRAGEEDTNAAFDALSLKDKQTIETCLRLHDNISHAPRDLQLEAFNVVHESNMSKLGGDGKPVYREDGKVLKGPNYQPPDMLKLVSEFFNNKKE